jgi:hypothetical protein
MNLFVNDKPVRIIKTKDLKKLNGRFHMKLNDSTSQLKATQLEGDVLVTEPSVLLLFKVFTLMRTKKLKKLTSITFATSNKKNFVNVIKSHFKIIKAAGGLVTKEDKILLMYRLKKWDLPKGKLDKNEKSKEGAVREVEEECNIKVKLESKICSTWHTYTQNSSKILKKTKWYEMSCLDDSNMKPQVEEDIEQLVWVDKEQAEVLLSTKSYKSIKYVFDKFHKQHHIVNNES